MNQYNYSIIIPHKNIPDLLQRCLDSIPKRNDVQVIVVDDDSDSEKVDFANFPGLNRSNTEVYFDKTGRGAGRARNVGLEHAKGKWILFLDADDLLTEDSECILSEVANQSVDILFCNYRSVLSENLSIEGSRVYYNYMFTKFNKDNDETDFRFYFHALWGKLIRLDLIRKYNIRCDETRYSNDVAMSIKCGLHASTFDVLDRPLVLITEREGSLASSQRHRKTRSKEECRTRIEVAMNCQKYVYTNAKNIDLMQYKYEAINYINRYKLSFLRFYFKKIFSEPNLCYEIFKQWRENRKKWNRSRTNGAK